MLALIAARNLLSVIGDNNQLPWRIPDDVNYFKKTTLNHTVIMGRKTFDSLPCGPLEGRENIVVTRNRTLMPGCQVRHNIEDLIGEFAGVRHNCAFIIGGGDLYEQTISHADYLDITTISNTIEGDVKFPIIDAHLWSKLGNTRIMSYGQRTIYARNLGSFTCLH